MATAKKSTPKKAAAPAQATVKKQLDALVKRVDALEKNQSSCSCPCQGISKNACGLLGKSKEAYQENPTAFLAVGLGIIVIILLLI